MLGELATLGKNIDCDFLVFMLEMAQQEARNVVRDNPTPGRPGGGKKPTKDNGEGLSAEELAALFARRTSGRH
jgi:hypothetical protein